MRKPSKKIAILSGVMVLGSAGTAFAFWTASGSGTGSAATSDGASNLVVSQASAPTNLAPGVGAGGISVSVTNNADNKAYVAQVVVSIARVSGPNITASSPCTADDYTLANPTMTTGAAELARNASTTFSGATLQFKNSTTDNQDGCKEATVHLAYAAS